MPGALKLLARSAASPTRLPEAVDMLATTCFLSSKSNKSWRDVGHHGEWQIRDHRRLIRAK